MMHNREFANEDDGIVKKISKLEKVITNQTVAIDRCYVINLFVLMMQISKLIMNPIDKI